MKQKLTVTLAVLLLTTASGAAMAQDRDHAERGQAQPHPQQQQHGGPPGGGHAGGPPHMEGGSRGPGPGASHGGQERSQAAPSGAPQHVGREAAAGAAAPRQFDHPRGQASAPGAGPGRAPGTGGHSLAAQFGGTRGAPPHWQPGRFAPVISAQSRFQAGAYRPPSGYYYRSWGFGDFLPRPWFVHDYWLSNFLDFGLPYPPPGYTWVRVGPDALMIDRFSGRIVQVVRGMFW